MKARAHTSNGKPAMPNTKHAGDAAFRVTGYPVGGLAG